MILSGSTIAEKIDSGELVVSPGATASQIQPASLDVRLGDEVYSFADDAYSSAETHIIEPGVRYLGHTKEYLEIPNTVAAQLAGRSSTGRKGIIIHKTAGWIDPDFHGTITLEIYNLGEEPVPLTAGERIGQLVFFELDTPSDGYDGKYQGQERPTKSIDDR